MSCLLNRASRDENIPSLLKVPRRYQPGTLPAPGKNTNSFGGSVVASGEPDYKPSRVAGASLTLWQGVAMRDFELGATVESTLRRLVNHAKKTIGACDSAGITLVRQRKVVAGVCTDEVARDIDLVQYDAQDGPCLDAVRYLQVFSVASIAHVDTWPAFRDAAKANGIGSSLSVPLAHRGHALGMLNLYSRVPDGFDECEQLVMAFATRASAAVWEAERRHARTK
jgi:putative methionine-R-sulfoxide reductase with GAF domain